MQVIPCGHIRRSAGRYGAQGKDLMRHGPVGMCSRIRMCYLIGFSYEQERDLERHSPVLSVSPL